MIGFTVAPAAKVATARRASSQKSNGLITAHNWFSKDPPRHVTHKAMVCLALPSGSTGPHANHSLHMAFLSFFTFVLGKRVPVEWVTSLCRHSLVEKPAV
jgi:hypothetical protein